MEKESKDLFKIAKFINSNFCDSLSKTLDDVAKFRDAYNEKIIEIWKSFKETPNFILTIKKSKNPSKTWMFLGKYLEIYKREIIVNNQSNNTGIGISIEEIFSIRAHYSKFDIINNVVIEHRDSSRYDNNLHIDIFDSSDNDCDEIEIGLKFFETYDSMVLYLTLTSEGGLA